MSRSRLRDKHMKKLYRGGHVPWYRYNESETDNEYRLDELPKNKGSRYITERCSNFEWLQRAPNFGGHKPKKGGHRMVSGIVRAKVKGEIQEEINNELYYE